MGGNPNIPKKTNLIQFNRLDYIVNLKFINVQIILFYFNLKKQKQK